MDETQAQFNQAYWASQTPEIRALQTLDPETRTPRAAELASKGFTIDVPIMVWAWDAYLVMKMRADYGYTWVPSALQPNISVAPGIGQPGTPSYDPANPPKGSIRVSTNPSDFPPFTPPPPPPQEVTELVGPQSIGTLYLTVAGDHSPDGTKFTDARGNFLKHVIITPFGPSAYWEKVA